MRTIYDYVATRLWLMMFQPFGKPQAHHNIELETALEADFFASDLGPLPTWLGLLGEFVAGTVTVGESETGYLQAKELSKALLETQIVQRQATPGARIRLLIVAEQVAESMLEQTLGERALVQRESGRWEYTGVCRACIISLSRLEFREETAALHLLGRGPHQWEAFQWWLRQQPSPRTVGLNTLIREIKRMMQWVDRVEWDAESQAYADQMIAEAKAAVSAEERELLLAEGIERGRLEGELLALLRKSHQPSPTAAEWTAKSNEDLRILIDHLYSLQN